MPMNRDNVYIAGTASSKASRGSVFAFDIDLLMMPFCADRTPADASRRLRIVVRAWWRVGEDSQQRGWSSSGNYLFKDAGCNGD